MSQPGLNAGASGFASALDIHVSVGYIAGRFFTGRTYVHELIRLGGVGVGKQYNKVQKRRRRKGYVARRRARTKAGQSRS